MINLCYYGVDDVFRSNRLKVSFHPTNTLVDTVYCVVSIRVTLGCLHHLNVLISAAAQTCSHYIVCFAYYIALTPSYKLDIHHAPLLHCHQETPYFKLTVAQFQSVASI